MKFQTKKNRMSVDYQKFDGHVSSQLNKMRKKRRQLKKENEKFNKEVDNRFKFIRSK